MYEKAHIIELFKAKCKALKISQAKAAVMAGVSGTTLSQFLNDKYPGNEVAVMKILANWLDYNPQELALAETRNYKILTTTLQIAQENSSCHLIIGTAGFGKTRIQREYAKITPNTILIKCDSTWSIKDFLSEVMRLLGKDPDGYTPRKMMPIIVNTILQMDKPLIMMDEADKLQNQAFILFITMYNLLEFKCGLTMSATSHLLKKIKRGIALEWKGYEEIWSRLGGAHIQLKQTTSKDVELLYAANNITDNAVVEDIKAKCNGDIRRVGRLIMKENIANQVKKVA